MFLTDPLFNLIVDAISVGIILWWLIKDYYGKGPTPKI